MKNGVRIILLGGFLGSGKTTLMTRIAGELKARGRRVGCITNDQGAFLVDTAYTTGLKIPTGQVAGGCFCCHFPDLIDNLTTLIDKEDPEIIFAEAVGSCTDLVSTVILPLKRLHPELAPVGYWVLADSLRLSGEYRKLNLLEPLSPKEVLLSHQLKEAVTILLSKAELFEDREQLEAEELLKKVNSTAEIFPVSAVTGLGLEELIKRSEDASVISDPQTIPLDYQVYAQAEAEYGWYNGRFTLSGDSSLDLFGLAAEAMAFLQENLDGDLAHAKITISAGSSVVKISLVGSRTKSDLIGDGAGGEQSAEVTVNLRTTDPPERLEKSVKALMALWAERFNLEGYDAEALTPAPPKPTHRLS